MRLKSLTHDPCVTVCTVPYFEAPVDCQRRRTAPEVLLHICFQSWKIWVEIHWSLISHISKCPVRERGWTRRSTHWIKQHKTFREEQTPCWWRSRGFCSLPGLTAHLASAGSLLEEPLPWLTLCSHVPAWILIFKSQPVTFPGYQGDRVTSPVILMGGTWLWCFLVPWQASSWAQLTSSAIFFNLFPKGRKGSSDQFDSISPWTHHPSSV